ILKTAKLSESRSRNLILPNFVSFVVEIEWNSKSGRLTTDENPNSPYPTSEPTANNYLNNFCASTAERTIGISAHHVDYYASIINLIQSLPTNSDNRFQIRTVPLKRGHP
ncbi:unnamed protein product, partial [Porites evermanni]